MGLNRISMEGSIPRVSADARISTRERPWREPSATIVWRTLYALGIAERTVLWNAFPWHPHRRGEPHSNRTPTPKELDAGLPILRAVLGLFPRARAVAIGALAQASMVRAGVASPLAVRHPANGGARKFAEQLASILRSKA